MKHLYQLATVRFEILSVFLENHERRRNDLQFCPIGCQGVKTHPNTNSWRFHRAR